MTSREQLLLAYLALNRDETILRQRISSLFWPETSEKQARTNLRQLLHHLRKSFPKIEHFLEINTPCLKWKTGVYVFVDVLEFNTLVSRAKVQEANNQLNEAFSTWQKAVEMYVGDLLNDFYDKWIEEYRDEYRAKLKLALEELMAHFERRSNYEKAIYYAEWLLRLDDLDEEVYYQLMKLNALNNDQLSALKNYRRCEKMLNSELDAKPSLKMKELYDRLKNQETSHWQDSAPKKGDTPLVGRHTEKTEIFDFIENSDATQNKVIFICGETGIGKTRLAQEVINMMGSQGFTTATAACYAHAGNLAFAPVVELLRTSSIFKNIQNLETVWQKELVRLLPELKRNDQSKQKMEPMTASWQKQQLFHALIQAINQISGPVLLLLDDLQWADIETLEWLHYLLWRSEKTNCVTILATIRSGALHENNTLMSLILELRKTDFFLELELTTLSFEETRQLIQYLVNRELDPDWITTFSQSTEGNPFFIVETVQCFLEKWSKNEALQTEQIKELPLPQSIQAVIQTRLVSLPESTRKLLELAAVIGRKFRYPILQSACLQQEQELIDNLDELCRRKLIEEQEPLIYCFQHEKIREVVYAGLSATHWAFLNRQVAEAIEMCYADNLQEYSIRLARHWEAAQNDAKAIVYYTKAGDMAKQIFANQQAEQHFRDALRLVNRSFKQPEQAREELNLCGLLGTVLVPEYGYGSKEVQELTERVLGLTQQLKISPSAPLLRMMSIGRLVNGQLTSALELGRQMYRLGQTKKDLLLNVEAHYVLGVTYHWQGVFVKAREHLLQAIQCYQAENSMAHLRNYAQHPLIICKIRLALVLWHLGLLEQAQKNSEEAIDLAEELDHPFSKAYALHWFAWLQNLKNDPHSTFEQANRSIQFSKAFNFPYFSTQSQILLGWARFKSGEIQQGIHTMRQGLASFRATGSEVGCAYYRSLIALALTEVDAADQGLALIKEARNSMKQTGECWAQSIVLRMKSAVYLKMKQAKLEEAKKALNRSIQIARRQCSRTDALLSAQDLRTLLKMTHQREASQKIFEDTLNWAMDDLKPEEQAALKNLIFTREFHSL